MPKLLIKFPSRERPHKFFPALENIISLIGVDDYLIIASFDSNDESMNNPEIIQRLSTYDKLQVCWGESRNKIHAVNRDIPTDIEWDYLIVTSDDMWYLKEGFGQQIINDFKIHFPDGDGLLHYPDGHANERLVTLPVMGRKYYERFGYVYHPSYQSVYPDNEQMQVAKKFAKYRYIHVEIVQHRHPIWGHGKADALLKKTEDPINYKTDRETFLKRSSKNFDLDV